ncbi:protein kinase family protein [Haliangium ochraceum]|uniref:Serine/threonine protein kinase with WD40 repeats n=1 Tax=Haliangium ochraceum (strain DSM 14365 / JCM 11303 / SMP-2) TaxID=502025 RepID=D0LTD6_HALO1|nr:serine/threonine protein kinase with WD40 repeats [Haliangium ochraceum DSM 14365]
MSATRQHPDDSAGSERDDAAARAAETVQTPRQRALLTDPMPAQATAAALGTDAASRPSAAPPPADAPAPARAPRLALPHAGQTAQSPPPTSTRIGQYEFIRSLGRGGMGEVFLARDLRLGRLVAVKRLRTRRPELAERFLREARTTARCMHENIVVIHKVGEFGGEPYMVLEYIEGQPLRAWLRERADSEESVRVWSLDGAAAPLVLHGHEDRVMAAVFTPDGRAVISAGFDHTVRVWRDLSCLSLDAPRLWRSSTFCPKPELRSELLGIQPARARAEWQQCRRRVRRPSP